ncbi:MAG: hypothetical protein AAFO94_16275 [Bacteroidota bacterium]
MIDQHTHNFPFESRQYHADATPAEIQAIKESVFIYDPKIVYVRELPVASSFSINLIFDQTLLLGEQLGDYGMLIDIRNTARPDAKTRRAINQRFYKICEEVSHVAFCTGKNTLINTAAKFVMFQTNLESFSVNRTPEEAAASIKKAIRRQQARRLRMQ